MADQLEYRNKYYTSLQLEMVTDKAMHVFCSS